MVTGTQAPPSLQEAEEYVTYLVLLLRWPQLPLWGQSNSWKQEPGASGDPPPRSGSVCRRQTLLPSRLVPHALPHPWNEPLNILVYAHLALYDIILKPLGLIGNPEHSHREGEVECHLEGQGVNEQSQGLNPFRSVHRLLRAWRTILPQSQGPPRDPQGPLNSHQGYRSLTPKSLGP